MEKFQGIAHSAAMKRVCDQAAQFARIPRPILIRGERGTGKELFAHFIHQMSDRNDKPFISMNCAAFNDELINAEMYGHEKGAFTGAHTRKIGRLEQADNGTLFMDEIGNMSLNFQEKILRVIEYQEFERLSGNEKIKVDVRLISATNANLEELMEDNLFRRDLFDRLTFAEIHLPPLRQRRDDIPHLIVHFVKQLHSEIPNIMSKTFERETVEALMDYYWPGNVRELKNVVERVYLYGHDTVLTVDCLPAEITGMPSSGRSFHDQVEAFKKKLILNSLVEADNNQRLAADKLKMTYDQFRHFYRKYIASNE